MILTLQSNLDKQKYYVLEFQNSANLANLSILPDLSIPLGHPIPLLELTRKFWTKFSGYSRPDRFPSKEGHLLALEEKW